MDFNYIVGAIMAFIFNVVTVLWSIVKANPVLGLVVIILVIFVALIVLGAMMNWSSIGLNVAFKIIIFLVIIIVLWILNDQYHIGTSIGDFLSSLVGLELPNATVTNLTNLTV